MRTLSVALIALMAAAANAQFNGPAPLAWRWLPTSGQASSGSPLAVGDTIYISCGGRIYALDRATGNRKWQFPPEDPIPGTFKTAPIMANGVLVGTGDNKIMYGVDPQTGVQKWSFVLPTAPVGQPVAVEKGVIQALSSSQLVSVDPETGTSNWKSAEGDLQTYTISDRISGQIASWGTSILYFTQRNELHSVDAVTRTEGTWPRPIRFTSVDASAQPLVYADTVYVASGTFLAAINPLSGAVNWQVPTGFEADYSPAASAQGIFICSKSGEAMLFGLGDGKPTDGMPKPIQLGSSPATKPSAVGDRFVVLTSSGSIDLIDPTSGAVVWNYTIRPVGKIYEKVGNQNGGFGGGSAAGGPGGGPGGGAGGPGGGAGFAGGQGPGRGGAGGTGGASGTRKELTEVEASGPAILDGQTLLVPARDSSLLAFDKDLGVDLTPPTAQMLFPTPGDQVAGLPPLLLYFKIRDEGSGVNEKTLQVKIDGKPYEFVYKRDGSATVTFSNEGKNRTLSDGRHVITVDVSDWLGNVAHQSFSLTIDNSLPPIKLPGQETTRPGFGGGGFGGPGKGGGGG